MRDNPEVERDDEREAPVTGAGGSEKGEALPGFQEMVGQSEPMLALFQRLRRLAAANPKRAILIQGEHGTGKELVAHALHQLSPRRQGPIAAVNCGAFSPPLLANELFGHEKGAYTDAGDKQIGILPAAHGGTVFLDEIGELPLAVQDVLLRFLESREVQPLGGGKRIPVDVRVLAATNRNLVRAVEEGLFREDLFYRLARYRVLVPPLRERLDDLPLLVEAIRRRANREDHLAIEGVTPAALARLAACPWPGNVRHLELVVEESMFFKRRGWLDADDLIFWPVPNRNRSANGSATSGNPVHVAAPSAHVPRVAEPPAPSPTEGTAAARRRLPADARNALIRRLAATSEGVSRSQLADAAGISGEHARRELLALTQAGVLRRIGESRDTRYVLA
jgi:DNA-binding NtrC family response regulator